MVGTAELILFAIQAGVKLANAGRNMYIDETIRGEVVLPLPSIMNNAYSTATSELILASHADDGTRQRIAYLTIFREILETEDHDKIVATYLEYAQKGVLKPQTLHSSEMASLAIIRQWESKDSLPSPMQRVAGTLVEIAVDYFIHVPGTLSADSTTGKTITSLLNGLDDVEFDEARWDSIAIALFTSGVEAIHQNPELFTDDSDDTKTSIVRTAVTGIATDLALRMKDLNGPGMFDAEDRIKKFGTIVLRSVLVGSSRAVVSNPDVLGLKDNSDQALVTGVGTAFLDLLLGEKNDSELTEGLRRLASMDGLTDLVHASLQVVAQHPDLLTGSGSKPTDKWLTNIVTGLYELYPEKDDLFDPELLSNIAYLVLHHGVNDLNTLVLKDLSAGQHSLAVEVASSVLSIFITPPNNGKPAKWDMDLSRDEITELVSGVLGSIAAHPEWILSKSSNRKIASTVLPLIIEVLGKTGAGNQGPWLKALVRSEKFESVLAAVLTSGLLNSISQSESDQHTADAIAMVVSKVLQKITDQGLSGINVLLDYTLLHDILKAVEKSGVLDTLLESTGTQSTEIMNKLTSMLNRLRVGDRLAIPEMIERLTVD